jgi:hypothetical protein
MNNKREQEIKDIVSKKERTVRKVNSYVYAFGVNIPFCDNIDITELEDFVSFNKKFLSNWFGFDKDSIILIVDKGHFRIESKHEYQNNY